MTHDTSPRQVEQQPGLQLGRPVTLCPGDGGQPLEAVLVPLPGLAQLALPSEGVTDLQTED